MGQTQSILEKNCLTYPLQQSVFTGIGGLGIGFGIAFSNGSHGSLLRKLILKNGVLYGVLGYTFFGSKCVISKLRHKDDYWSDGAAASVMGLALGLRAKSPVRVVAFPTALFVTFTFLSKLYREEFEILFLNHRARREKRQIDGFFDWPSKDPFKDHMERIKANEADNSK
ncbi:hypothetical protein HK099_005464 [Clydaea vesicula]|uniref:Uncharacterized protein n=1 Tax=Clydaea vesicula TaxID=447962 RepID=A0AAD5XUX4_9FUNG|nr:hypothetical protein HK099_005464 [Clydaea vesicula]KAJ3387258.1 hypothetical protein HDU92_002028 [Lobulomyces angularis]